MNVKSHIITSSPTNKPSGWGIVYRRIDELKPDPGNPRRHSKKQIRQIAASIKAFGFNVPILLDRDGNVIAGHGRLAAACELGMTEVPTLCLDHLTPEQARAFRIADNRLAEIATWNDRLLAQQLKDLSLIGLDFSLEVIGFEIGEIDLRIKSLEEAPERTDDPFDAVPDVTAGPAISKIGDQWLLGRHCVLCGSAFEATALASLMGEERAAMVFTTPDHAAVDGRTSCLAAIHHRPFGAVDRSELTAFLREVFRNLAAFSIDGALHYICMDWRHLGALLAASRDVYRKPKDLCVWVKANAGMGELYRNQHELVFVFENGRNEHGSPGQSRRKRSNVWRYSFARRGAGGNLCATVKPVAMVADAIRNGAARGKIVLDAFLGSGTTVIGAERTGRRCYGLERDPACVDTIIRRWQAMTGGRARHAVSDRTFDDFADEAEATNAA